MFERVRRLKVSSPEAVGGLLIFVGLVLFLVVFIAVFPVLANPVDTYDKWFLEDDETATLSIAVVNEEEDPAEPKAAYRFVAEAIVIEGQIDESTEGEELEAPLMRYQASFEDRSEPSDAEIANRNWDFGDGTGARGATVSHTYREPGVYSVQLTVEDENGFVDEVEGDVEVPEEGRSFGRVESQEELDLSGIESAVEDAVVTIEGSVDDTLDSFGSAARSVGIIVLFALAAIASTVVAWRVTRSGIMLLRPAEKMRLRVKSADMHVEVGKNKMEEVIADGPVEDELLEAEADPKLVEV